MVRNIEYPSIETAGCLPVLIDGQFIVPEDDALAYLHEHYPSTFDLDSKLSGAKRAQVAAFHALVSEKLAPALGASRYRDERNFVQNVRAVILRATRFPLGPTCASAERRRGVEEQRWRGLMEGGVGLGEVLARARVVYRELDNWLGASTGDFFFGREPTSFDACLFGHLVEALTDVNVLVIVTTFGNLMRFFRRIAEEFFEVQVQQQQQGFVVASDLKEYYKRADYVNSRNPFNQVEAAKLCAEAPLVPEPMLHKFLEEGEGPKSGARGGEEKKKAGATAAGPGGAAAGGPKKKAEELEEERERHKENVVWLTVVGGVVGFFLLFQGILALATGEIEIVTEGGEEEGEEEGGKE